MFSIVSALTSIGIISANSNGIFNNETKNNYDLRTQVEPQYESSSFNIDDYETDDNLAVTLETITTNETSASLRISFALGENASSTDVYYVGYGESAEDEMKGTVVYSVKTIDNVVETRTQVINRYGSNNYYDAVGAIGQDSFTTKCNIELDPGDTILTESFTFINFFKANATVIDAEKGTYSYDIPRDESGKWDTSAALATTVLFPTNGLKTYTLDQFAKFDYNGTTKFSGYGSINIKVENLVTESFYQSLNSRIYRNNSDKIANGTAYIRTRIYVDGNTNYVFYHAGQEEPEVLTSVSQYVELNKTGTLVFTFKGLNVDDIEDFYFTGYTIYVDIFQDDDDTTGPVRQSAVSFYFSKTSIGAKTISDKNGTVVKDTDCKVYHYNVDLIMWLSIALFIVAYEGVSAFLYFYWKNKYKNDEFKRMDAKKYYKTNTTGLITCLFLILTIEAICFRTTIINNSLPVYNTLDIYIVVCGIASIIMVGYFIKYFSVQIKNIRDAKRNEKLKLNKNTIEDGTLIIVPSTKGDK